MLARGINLTNWFRFPARDDDRALADYMTDAELGALHRAGFSFVRLAVQPQVVHGRADLLQHAIQRIERQGLGVMVGWHMASGALNGPGQRRELLDLWERTAPALRPLDPRLTFPEVLNEPDVEDAGSWEQLQTEALGRIRRALPGATVVLTGANWGSLAGLLALHPVQDRNVVYSFHDYEPPVLTTLGAFEPGLDRAALARLPFPVTGPGCDAAAAATAQQHTRDVVRWYCGEHWDAARVAGSVHRAGDWARAHDVAVVAGEFGASNALPAPTRLAWIVAMRTALEREGIGWALWGYDDSMGFGRHPGAGGPLDPELLDALGLHARR